MLVDPETRKKHRERISRMIEAEPGAYPVSRMIENLPENIAARQAAARATITEREQRRQTLAAGRRKVRSNV